MTLEAGPDTDHLHVGDNIEGTFICYRVTENAMALEDDTLVLPRDLPLTADLFSRDAIISKDDQHTSGTGLSGWTGVCSYAV